MVKSERSGDVDDMLSAVHSSSTTPRTKTIWSCDEVLRLLRTWLGVLQQQRPSMNDDESRVAAVPEAVLLCTHSRIDELSRRDNIGVNTRQASSMQAKMEQLARMYRVITNYNKQQAARRASTTTQSPTNHYLALSLKRQKRVFATYHTPSRFTAIDADMFELLASIDRARRRRPKLRTSTPAPPRTTTTTTADGSGSAAAGIADTTKRSVVWTKDEEWALITAWRQVVERTMRSPQHTLPQVHARFSALALAGTPRRTKGSIKAKLANLVVLYRLVAEFNALHTPHGPLASATAATSSDRNPQPMTDWFSVSEDERTQHVLDANVGRVNRVLAFDRDTFNALDYILHRVDAAASGSSNAAAAGRSGSSSRVAVNASRTIIELLSDTDDDENEDDNNEDDDDDWEMLSVAPPHWANAPTAGSSASRLPTSSVRQSTPSTPNDSTAGATLSPAAVDANGFAWHTLYDPSAWTTEQQRRVVATPAPVLASVSPPEPIAVASPASSDNSEDDSSTEAAPVTPTIIKRKRKRMKREAAASLSASTQATVDQFTALLAKLKHERAADKLKRREERIERQELTALITEERKLRRKDRKERLRERREWELERDQLKLKLKSLRAKFRLARRQLSASS